MNKKILLSGLSAIVLLSVLAMVVPASADIQMADEFGVEDAMGNPGDYVNVLVNITNVKNGPILAVDFELIYNKSILNIASITKGELTDGWSNPEQKGEYGIGIVGSPTTAIQNGANGSVVVVEFEIIGVGGAETDMNLSNIIFFNTPAWQQGTAPAKNGTFRVDAGPPSVTNPTANPGTIKADGFQESQLNVTVVDDIAVDAVVTVNLTQIGGPAEKVMEMIDDTLYSTTTNASIGTTPWTYYLPINATDLLGNYNNTEVFTLIVAAPANGSITGKITYTNGTGIGIAGVVVNLTDGSAVASTTTDSGGNYTFPDVIPGDYYVNASKPKVEDVTGFWDNSTDVTVTAGVTTEVNMMLWLKGDLNNNGISADIGDVAMMWGAWKEEITADWRYNLNNNEILADIGDVAMMWGAWKEEIVLNGSD